MNNQDKLLILIPTYNRPENIASFLASLEEINGAGDLSFITILFADSSKDSRTENIVTKYINNNNSKINIAFRKYPDTLCLDEKLFSCMKSNGADYFYLLGDSYILDFDRFIKIFKEEYGKADVINVIPASNKIYEKFMMKMGGKIDAALKYNDKIKYFRDFFWLDIMYGATIISKKVVDYCVSNNLNIKYKDNSFSYPCYIFDYLSVYPSNESVYFTNCIKYTNNKRKPSWWKKDKLYDLWAVELSDAFDYLPIDYSNDKHSVIKETNIRTAYFTKKFILLQRADGILNYKSFVKYKDYFKKTIKNYHFMEISCFIPKFILKFGLYIKRHLS
jgi:hypothetical protein